MAISDKNIRITTNKNKATGYPNIVFTGSSAGTSVLTLEVRDDNTVAFTGLDGDVFSLDYNLSTGTIWSVNDKSGTPFLRASAGGTIGIAELGSGVLLGVGQSLPQYKLDVKGWAGFASSGDNSYTVLIENGLSVGNNALSIRAANALRFYNSGNTLYTGFVGAQSGVNTTYTLPTTTPSSIGASFLTSTQSGVLAWIAAPSGSSSGTVNAGTASYAAFYASTSNAVSENANLQFTGTGLSVGGFIQSSSITSGSIYVRGGAGITGNAFIGGTTNLTNTTASISSNSGTLVVSGGLGLAGNAFIGGTLNVPSATASNFNLLIVSSNTSSTSTSSGSLTNAGGLGIGGNAFIGGTTNITSSSSSFASNSGALVVSGGLGIVGNSFIGGTVNITNSAASISSNNGALVVSGGLGLAGNAFIGGTINAPSSSPSNISNFVVANAIVKTGTWSGSTVTAFYGGTGLQGPSQIGDIIVADTTTTWTRYAASANVGYVLTSTGANSAPQWQAVSAAASSVQVASGSGNTVVFLTGVNAVTGSGLALTTISSIFVRPDTGYITATGISSANIFTPGTNINFSDATNGTGVAYAGGNARLAINFTTEATTGTAALYNLGGFLSTKNTFFTGTASTTSILSTISATNTQYGALSVSGGVAIQGNAFIGGTFTHISNASSISTNSGSVVLSGGLGLVGNAFIGGTVVQTNNTASISTNSGAITVAGGLGLAGNAFIGGTLNVPSSTPSNINLLIVSSNTSSTSTSTGALINSGGLGIAGNAFIGGTVNITNSSSSTSSNVGALVVTGGLGIIGNAFIGGTFVNVNSTSSIGTNSGAITVAGGVGIAGNAFIGGTTNITNNSSSTSSNVGALVVTGGIGLVGNAFIGGTVNITNLSASGGTNVGGLVVAGGAAVGQSLSIGGRLQIFNGSSYAAFRYTGTAGTTYTLPALGPSIGTSVLASDNTGVMVWLPMSATGGGSPGGTTDGDIQYKVGSSFAAISDFNFDQSYTQLTIKNFPGTTPITAIHAAVKILGQGVSWTGSSSNGTLLGINGSATWAGNLIEAQKNGAQRLILDSSGYLTLGPSGTGFTLPITNGSAGQVLTANASGIASWTTVTGGSSSGGTAYPATANQIAYYAATGNTVQGSATFTNNTATGVVEITHTTEATNTTSGALQVDGGAGIAKSLFVGTTLSVGLAPSYNITNNLASFVSSVNTYNQVVIQNKSNGSSASADFVLNNDLSTDTTYYGNLGINSSTYNGTGAIGFSNAVYLTSTSGHLVLGTTTQDPIRFVVNGSATDTLYIDGAGTAISCFANFGLRNASDLRFWNSGSTFYAGIQGGGQTASYILTMPTAPVGAGVSSLIIGADGQMYFASQGSGIAFSSASGTIPQIRAKRPLSITFCAGYTPASAGADVAVYRIPESFSDGTTSVNYALRRFQVRVETPSAGQTNIMLEKYSGSGAFAYAATGSTLLSGVGASIGGAGLYVTSITTFAGSLVTSGDNLRINFTTLNATHATFFVQLTLEEV